MNCEDEIYSAFEWVAPVGSTDLGSFTHIIEAHTALTEQFLTVTGSIVGCTPYYSIFKEDASNIYQPYTDSNASIDNIALSPAVSPTEILFTSSVLDDAALDTQTWKIRVSVASITPFSLANNPKHIYFEISFDHPCRYAAFDTKIIPDMNSPYAVITYSDVV